MKFIWKVYLKSCSCWLSSFLHTHQAMESGEKKIINMTYNFHLVHKCGFSGIFLGKLFNFWWGKELNLHKILIVKIYYAKLQAEKLKKSFRGWNSTKFKCINLIAFQIQAAIKIHWVNFQLLKKFKLQIFAKSINFFARVKNWKSSKKD